MSRLELSLLGPFQVRLDGNPVTAFESAKVRALLAYLAVESDRPQPRESLADLLWPDWPQSAALRNLTYALADLRTHIDDRQALPPFLLIQHDSLQINPESDLSVDVWDFEQPLPEDPQSITEQLLSKVSFFRGPFLEAFSLPDSAPFEAWLAASRERVSRRMAQYLGELVQAYTRQGEYAQALAYARRQARLEPWLEEAHQAIMRLLALSGQRGAALAQFETCRKALQDELGVEPGAETIQLYEAIREGRFESLDEGPLSPDLIPPAPGAPPYKGLQYFDEGDAALFFGRELLTAELVSQIRDMLFLRGEGDALRGCCFLAVVGASGSGKSSVVRAGLVPALKSDQPLVDGKRPPPGSSHWLTRIITPTQHPLEALAISLTRDTESVTAAATLVDDMQREPRSLHFYVQRLLNPSSSSNDQGEGFLLLVVDQFEELFTLCRSEPERIAFLDNLLTAAQGPALVIIVLRADFYAHCAQYPRLRQALCSRQEYIGPMDAGELRRAIEEPARQGGWEFEPGLVDLILRDVGASQDSSPEPGALPLLEHALLETWQRRRGRTLTLQGYAEAGGVHGAIARTAEGVYARLDPQQQILARRIFLRLTELGEGTQDTRRRVSLQELLPQEEREARLVNGLLKTLADARLVTLAQGTAEVAHEALIREWPALRGWLNEDREGLHLHRHLTEAAQAWEAMSRDLGELYRGARLAQASEWAAQPEHAGELNTQEAEFLRACEAHAEREAQEHEAQRQRELEAAQKLAETERQRAAEQALASQRLRQRALGLALALAAAVVLLGTAVWFARSANQNLALAENEKSAALAAQREAERLSKISFIRELASASLANLHQDPNLSLLLSTQALSITQAIGFTDTGFVQQLIHDALLDLRWVNTFRDVVEDPGSIDYHPDGTLIVYGDLQAKRYIIQDTASGLILLTVPGSGQDAAFSPDGRYLASLGESGVIHIWDLAFLRQGGETPDDFLPAITLSGESMLDFNTDGRWLAADTQDGMAVWNFEQLREGIESGAVAPEARPSPAFSLAHPLKVIDFEFFPDGSEIVGVDEKGTTILWWMPDQVTYWLTSSSTFAQRPDGKAAALTDGSVWFWEESVLKYLPLDARNWVSIAYSADGKIAAGAEDGLIRVMEDVQGQLLFDLQGHAGSVVDLAFSPDGSYLASISKDHTIKIWDMSPEAPSELPGVSIGQEIVAESIVQPTSGGSFWATAGKDGEILLWDASTLKLIDSISLTSGNNENPEEQISAIAIQPDGKLLAFAQQDGRITIWNRNSGKLSTLLPESAWIKARKILEFSPDGKILAVQDGPQSIDLLDALSGQVLSNLSNPSGDIYGWNFSPDSIHFGLGDAWGNIHIWDLGAIGEPRSLSVGDAATIEALEFNSDGTRLLVTAQGSQARKFITFDLETGQPVASLDIPTPIPIYSNYSQDFHYLVTWSKVTKILNIWDLSSQMKLLQLKSPGRIASASFTPDGKILTVRLDENQSFRVYGLDPNELLNLAIARLHRGWQMQECQQYLHQESCPAAP